MQRRYNVQMGMVSNSMAPSSYVWIFTPICLNPMPYKKCAPTSLQKHFPLPMYAEDFHKSFERICAWIPAAPHQIFFPICIDRPLSYDSTTSNYLPSQEQW